MYIYISLWRVACNNDRRNFTAAGAAAGVAAAFTSPIGAMLFVLEELVSFWTLKLGWLIFFCSMMASFTSDMFSSSVQEFHYEQTFGMFKTEKFFVHKVCE